MNVVATSFEPWAALLGGGLIGLSATLLMASHGKVAGLSSIFGGLLRTRQDAEFRWRALFILGLLAGALATARAGGFDPASLSFSGGWAIAAAGGLLVGAGTALGSGCTSGHGICGLARLSRRSLVATLTFMGVATATVFVTRHLIGG